MRRQREKKQSTVKPTLRYFMKSAWHYKKSVFFVYLAQTVGKGVSPFVTIIFPKLVIDELLGEQRIDMLIAYVVGLCVLNLFFYSLDNILTCTIRKFDDEYKQFYARQLSEQSMKMDFEYTENPAVLDNLEKAKTGMQWYSGGLCGILGVFSNIVQNLITIAGVTTLFILGCPWLLLIQLAALVLITVFNSRINRIDLNVFSKLSAINRGFGYIFWGLSDLRCGKDIRLYGAAKMMGKKATAYNDKNVGIFREKDFAQLPWSEATQAVNTVRDALSYLYIGWLALSRTISIGDFSMYFGATGSFYWALHAVVAGIQEIGKRCNYAYEFVKFMDYPATLKCGSEKVNGEKHTIEFRNVSFKYPRTDKYILRNLSLKINSGEHLSVVGLNGAGKTTFIKLLCRLYDVNEGEILLDGKNIADYGIDEYRRVFAVVFQDFSLFAFSFRENIMLQNADVDDEELKRVIELAGLTQAAEKLDNGLDTNIFKSYDEHGTELSGGQQQKLAIARALQKDAPVVILDEPTAALDPIAEYEIYRQFDTLVGGKTAIYISHRLSSCKFCDKIAVFAGETIAEYGTHDELVGKENGIYAEMFKAQAQYYVESA